MTLEAAIKKVINLGINENGKHFLGLTPNQLEDLALALKEGKDLNRVVLVIEEAVLNKARQEGYSVDHEVSVLTPYTNGLASGAWYEGQVELRAGIDAEPVGYQLEVRQTKFRGELVIVDETGGKYLVGDEEEELTIDEISDRGIRQILAGAVELATGKELTLDQAVDANPDVYHSLRAEFLGEQDHYC